MCAKTKQKILLNLNNNLCAQLHSLLCSLIFLIENLFGNKVLVRIQREQTLQTWNTNSNVHMQCFQTENLIKVKKLLTLK
jgi:hypothetical protein